MHVGTDFLKLPPVTGQYWSLFQCSMLGTSGTCGVLNWLAQLLTQIEEVGRWPTLLAQGYTSLIPKPGEEGPLGTRPLTVLSMVYRLWAGTRLWEVMRWQESWVHPRAFGFRLARGAVDAATVTQVLLELARLKGWRLEGLSLDYVKCFDLIPQAVVLRHQDRP